MRISMPLLLCSLLPLSLGCKKPASPSREPPVEEKGGPVPLTRLLEFQLRDKGQISTAPPDSNLPLWRDFAIRYSSEGPVRVYLVKTLPAGDSQTLYPPPDVKRPRLASGDQRLPESDKWWLRVAGLPRGAAVCLLLSTRTLTSAELRCPSGLEAPRGPVAVSETLTAIPLHFTAAG